MRLLNVDQAAQKLGCTVQTLMNRRWRRGHEIPEVRLGKMLRFEETALDMFIQQYTQSKKEEK